VTVRVLLVDDHEIVRRGLRFLLLSQSKYEVCGEAVDGEDALEKAQQLKPDVILMDVSMPKRNGLEATRLIRSMLPDSEVLILSQHESPEMVRQAFKAGARGYVVKSSVAKDLPIALDTVSRHEPFFDSASPEFSTRPGYVDAEQNHRYHQDGRAKDGSS
jgi:DNA-binding NarL/FixJ family response regulator